MRDIIGTLTADQKKQVLTLKKEIGALLRHFRSNASRDEELQKAGESGSEFHRVAKELFQMLKEKAALLEEFMNQVFVQDIPKDILDLYANLVANDAKYSRVYGGGYLVKAHPIPTPERKPLPPTQGKVRVAEAHLADTKDLLLEYNAAQEYLADIRRKRALVMTPIPIVDPYKVALVDNLYGQFTARVDEIEDSVEGKLYGEVPQATWDEYFLLLTAIANYRPLKANS
jgi:hypothetical protein